MFGISIPILYFKFNLCSPVPQTPKLTCNAACVITGDKVPRFTGFLVPLLTTGFKIPV